MSVLFLNEKNLTFNKVKKILKNVDPQKVSSAPPDGKLKPNQVFVYQVHEDTSFEFWRHDGFRWRNLRSQSYPKSDPWCRRVTQQLIVNGQLKDFWRREFYPFGEKVSPPNSWNIPFVVVYYYGTFNFEETDSHQHGNCVPTPLKSASKLVDELLVDQNNEKKSNNPPVKEKQTARKRTGGYGYCYDKNQNPVSSPLLDETGPITDVSKSPTSDVGVKCLLGSSPEKEGDHGDTENQPASLSNSVTPLKTGRVFKRAHPSVKVNLMKKLKLGKTPSQAYREVTYENISSSGDSSKIPRNRKQVYNIQQKLKDEQRHDDIYEVYLFAKQNPDIIVELKLIPQLVVVQVHPQMTKHVISLIPKFERLIFHYDTTFDIGPFYTSILSMRHPVFKKEPLVPVAVLFHQTTSGSCHDSFFKIIDERLGINRSSTLIISDREKGIKNAVEGFLPKAQQVFCWNHLRRNVKDWVAKNIRSTNSLDYPNEIFKLLHSESQEEYETSLQDAIRSIWDPKFVDYYEKFLNKDVISSFRPVLSTLGIYSPLSGITNNPAESANAVLKRIPDVKKCTLFQASSAWYFHQAYSLLEIKQGFEHLGDYVLNGCPPGNIFIPEEMDDIIPKSMTSTLIFQGNFPANLKTSKEYKSKSIHEETTMRGLARFFVRNKRVNLLPENGTFIVNGLLGKTFMVNLKEVSCTCLRVGTCEHRLAAMISAGVDGKLRLKRCQPNIGLVYRKTIRKATGKKKGQKYRLRVQVPPLKIDCQGSDNVRNPGMLRDLYSSEKNLVVLNESKANLPSLTYNNFNSVFLRLPTGNIWFKEIKTAQPDLSTGELKMLVKALGNNVDEGTENWLVDSVLAGFLLRISKFESEGVVSVTPPEVQMIFTMEDSSLLFRNLPEDEQDYHDWSKICLVLLPYNLEGNHWVMIALKPQSKEILILDPLESFHLADSQLKKLQHLFNPKFSFGSSLKWDVKKPPVSVSRGNTSLQCGPFICYFAEALVREWPLISMPDVNAYRHHIINTLTGKCQPFLDKRINKCYRCGEKISEISTCGFCKSKAHKLCLRKITVRGNEFLICY